MLSNFKSSKMIIRTDKDQYLVGKNFSKLHLLGGKRENNESSFQNLRREVLEESSYVIDLQMINEKNFYFKIFDNIINLLLDKIVYDEYYKCFFFIFITNDINDIIFQDMIKLMEINQYLIITKLIHAINLENIYIQAYYFLEKYMKTRKKTFLHYLINLYYKNNISWKNEYYNIIKHYSVFLEIETLYLANLVDLKLSLRENNIIPIL
jgi:hypothetical protein